MKKTLVALWFILIFSLYSALIYQFAIKISEKSDFRKDNFKDCIIENKDYLSLSEYASFNDTTFKMYFKDSYYTDMTIKLKSDSSYFVIFWGNRESKMWNIRKDYFFTVDIPYNRSIGNDVSKDIEILNICKFSEVNVY